MADFEDDSESDIEVFDMDTDDDDRDHDDDGLPNQIIRGPWFNVVDVENFRLPDPEFDEDTGPVNFQANLSTLEYFMAFLEGEENSVIDILVMETNRYADQVIQERTRPPRILPKHSRLKDWRPVTEQEILAFIGLILSMGVVKKPTIKSYWECNKRTWSMATPNFSAVMSRNRFQAILQFLHCNDNTTAIPNGQPGYDPMHKINPVLDILNETFGNKYRLNQNVCVDERIVGFKGRHKIKQYISKKKAHRWGIKLWVLADSESGYTHHIDVYKGKNRDGRYPHGQGYQVVMDLMTPNLHKDHHVTVDSFFTSPTLIHDLRESGTHCTGTVISSRKGMPPSFRHTRVPKGEMIVKTQGPVMAILWSDRRIVTILSTTGEAKKIETTNSKGTVVIIPAVVDRYNHTMGGVDLGDQMIQQFEPGFKSRKMWRKLLFNLLVTAAVNAYICYRDVFVVQRKMNHLNFHETLCQELIGDYREGRRNQQIRVTRLQNRTDERLTGRHFISKIPGGKRKKCVVCSVGCKKSRIQWWCRDCRVGLCAESCFERYHTLYNYEE